MKRLLWVMVVFLVMGCAAMPTKDEMKVVEQPVVSDTASDKAHIVFYREWKFGGGGVSYYVYDGTEKIGAAWNGCYFTKDISPGQHTFWGETESKKYITINLDPGKTYYINMAIAVGFWAGTPEFTLVTPEVAMVEMKETKYCELVPVPVPVAVSP